MKASYITSYGGLEVHEFGDMPDPLLSSGKLMIQVKAVSLNPIDYKIRQGKIKLITGSKFPKILGTDFSGVVKEIGSGAAQFKLGDRVYGTVYVFFGKQGALAEYLSAAPKQLRKMPDTLTFEEAASLPVASLTALNGLRKYGKLAGKEVLVNGATGGVGHFTVQIAAARGAHITAVCGAKNMDLARKLGAHEILDYTKQDLSKYDKKFDMIFDAFGKMDHGTIRRLLNKKGLYASTLFSMKAMISSPFVRILNGIQLTSANMRSKKEDYQEIEDLLLAKRVKPLIENVFELSSTKKAFDMAENGGPRGKVIVRI